jgi:hypothetical protein
MKVCSRATPPPVPTVVFRSAKAQSQPSTALKLPLTLCITSTESVVRRRFQPDRRRTPAPLDHFRRSLAFAGPRARRHLHQPRCLLQSSGSGRRICDRARRPPHATAPAPGYRPADPRSFLAECFGINLRGGRDFLRPLAFDAAYVSECRPGGCDLLRHQRHCGAACLAQATLVSERETSA